MRMTPRSAKACAAGPRTISATGTSPGWPSWRPRPRTRTTPEDLLAQLTSPASDAEEAAIAHLAYTQLGPVEAALGGVEGALDEEGAALETLFLFAWPDVEDLLALDEPEDESAEGLEVFAVARPVLVGVARIGMLLACARWMAAGRPIG